MILDHRTGVITPSAVDLACLHRSNTASAFGEYEQAPAIPGGNLENLIDRELRR
jgi:hypothetical protein